MRTTPKGQVTIPRKIRERAGLLPGTEVEFLYDGTSIQIVKANRGKTKRGARLVGHMRGHGSGNLSTDQIMALTRR